MLEPTDDPVVAVIDQDPVLVGVALVLSS